MSAPPLLHVVIPTRNRPAMALRAAASVLGIPGDGIVVTILDNSDEPLVVPPALAADARLSVSRAPRTLAMSDNWERGLESIRGRFVTYLADKDHVVGDAFRDLVGRLGETDADVVSYRKAWFCERRRQLHHYATTGRVVRGATAPLMESRCREPRHIHSAPMIYNSAVSARFLDRVRAVTGRFFRGTAADVSSGLLIGACLDEYTLLDRMVVLAHGGDWSIGSSQAWYGRTRGGGRSFLAEQGDDPMARLGLPFTVTSSVVETFLEVKKHHPGAFAAWNLDWRAYLRRADDEIDGMQIDRRGKRMERQAFRSPRSVVPRRDFLVHRLTSSRGVRWLRRRVGRVLARLGGEASPAGGLATDLLAERPWDDAHYRHVTPADSFEEALGFIRAAEAGVSAASADRAVTASRPSAPP